MILDYKRIPVFYTDEGQGQAIVLLHGFLENSSMWKNLKPHLIAQSCRVICIDLLGHGQTGCLGYVHTMEAMAEAVYAVLEELNIKSCKIIGHSMGGYVALALAEHKPSLISSLCLMNSSAIDDTIERKRNRDRAIEAVKQNHKTFIRLSISNLFAPDNREKFESEIEAIRNEALKTPLQGIVAALEGMKIRSNRVHILKNTAFYKMMIIGRKDPVLEYNTTIKQTKGTTVEIIEFPDGHMSHIENKEEFTYKILQLIEK